MKFHSFNEDFTIGFHGDKNDELKAYCRASIMDSVRDQQKIYKEKVGQKADLEGNWTITGVLTFSEHSIDGVDNNKLLELGKKAVRKIAAELNVKPIYISLHLKKPLTYTISLRI